ncbi:hypothetical protein SAMN02745126_06490 [Enhydrobacter aerosaccus]|uniref:Uncharacterized protein n=1 Tax=Enhydrobacter aerosaccus TaxID=225324 RepID=A0A1T4TLY6_9HYPH|nr:hypothetical protein [Enhydrobacter aerosaccus]SKA41338.1 hypothetical protein SAMN02745126_06490 [Enhydrobacter aerosaccus]
MKEFCSEPHEEIVPDLHPALIAAVVSVLTNAAGIAVTLFVAHQNKTSRLEMRMEEIARQLLSDDEWTVRSIEVVKAALHGLSDEDVRNTLLRAGAIPLTLNDPDTGTKSEVWGLVSRNRQLISGQTFDGKLASRERPFIIDGNIQIQQQQQIQGPAQSREISPAQKWPAEMSPLQLQHWKQKNAQYEVMHVQAIATLIEDLLKQKATIQEIEVIQ